MLPRVLFLALMLAVGTLAGFSRVALDRLAQGSSGDPELLYLPNGKHLKILSLGHANVLADGIYLWAIQYYSNYERKQRQRYVEHIFGNVITELDPRYVDAYWLGALIMIVENHDLEAGLRLLEKGIARNPDQWMLPYLAAWECYHGKQYARAAGFFEQAAGIPGAPVVVRRMRAGMMTKVGSLREALALWQEIAADPASDSLSIVIAKRNVKELQARLDVEILQAAVERFRKENGRFPARLGELEQGRYIPALPLASNGRPYRYDAETGTVSSKAGRILGKQ